MTGENHVHETVDQAHDAESETLGADYRRGSVTLAHPDKASADAHAASVREALGSLGFGADGQHPAGHRAFVRQRQTANGAHEVELELHTHRHTNLLLDKDEPMEDAVKMAPSTADILKGQAGALTPAEMLERQQRGNTSPFDVLKDWNEEAHPRAENGRFESGGSGKFAESEGHGTGIGGDKSKTYSWSGGRAAGAFAQDYVNAKAGDHRSGGPSSRDTKAAEAFHTAYSTTKSRSGFAGSGSTEYRHNATGRTFTVDRVANGRTFYGTHHHIREGALD